MRRISKVVAAAGAIVMAALPLFAQTSTQPPAHLPGQTAAQAAAQAPAQAATQAPSLDETQFLKNAEAFVRVLFAWGPDFQVKLGPLAKSPAPEFFLVPIEVTFNGSSDNGILYISKDGKTVMRGEMFDTSVDPFAANRAHLHAEGSPSKGPADAKVTIVEFSDFECPHCHQLYENMKLLEEHYPQIRVVFKNYPLVAIHPWALTAALGGHCAFQQSPEAFWKIHDGLFDNQDLISPSDIWDRLLAYAGQAGLDKDAFKACMASPEARKAVESDVAEAQLLNVNSTPTVFVNGRPVIGGEPTTLQQYIDYELGLPQAPQSAGQKQPGQPAPAAKSAAKPVGKP